MKTLLNKKIYALSFIAVMCISTAVAQISNRVRELTNHVRSFHYSPANKTALSEKLDAMRDNDKAPCLKKQNTLGGTGDDFGNKIIPAGGGSFIVCGGTNSADGDFKVPAANGQDAFIAKYNNHRQLEWTKTFGGSGTDFFNDIAQTKDGGYIAAGYTNSNDGDVSGNHGIFDVWVVKLSASGNIQWQKCLGGSGFDFCNALSQTIYGGYAIGAITNSNDGDVSGNHGDFDEWVVQLDPKGNLLSQHCYGGSGYDQLNAIVSSAEGSLIFGGITQSNDGGVSDNHGAPDAWVVKTNLSGKIIWQKTVGGSGDDEQLGSIAKTTDGNNVIDGYSFSSDGDINGKDTLVSFITKLNSKTGDIIWSKSYAKPGERGGFGIFALQMAELLKPALLGLLMYSQHLMY